MTELYGVKVRRDLHAVYNPSAVPSLHQFKDIDTDEEVVAELLRGGQVMVTAVHLRYRKDLGVYPGAPAGALYAVVAVHETEPADPDYQEGGNNRGAVVAYPGAPEVPGTPDVMAVEARAMTAVLARAAELAELTDVALRIQWWTRHLAERAHDEGMY